MRIRLGNVPRFYGVAQVRAFVAERLGVSEDRVLVRKAPKWDHALVSVRDAPEADMAPYRDALNGASWKKAVLTASIVEGHADGERRHNVKEAVPHTHINDQVAPLWRMPYAEQLARKAAGLRAVLEPFLAAKEDASVLGEPVASPETDGYRNKCEFSVGTGPDGLATVGFQMGAFKDGHVRVYSPAECPHVPGVLKDAAARLQDVVRASALAPYDRVAKTGFWRLMLGRVHDGDVMLMVQADPRGLPEGVSIDDAKKMVLGGFEDMPRLASLSLQQCTSAHLGVDPDAEPELLRGSSRVTQTLRCGPRALSFAISPLSFFQVNIPATERLYALVRDYVLSADGASGSHAALHCADSDASDSATVDSPIENASAESTGDASVIEPPAKRAREAPLAGVNDARPIVLDLCCGTGTIGMVLADAVAAVRGVELVASAVEDARENARRNGIANIAFECARVEAAIARVIRDVETMDDCAGAATQTARPVVVVLDPPRAGVHPSVIRAVRACSRVSRVVYVACNARAAADANFGDLTRAPSRALGGAPFRITRACPVDLFPHTEHVELVVSFDRH